MSSILNLRKWTPTTFSFICRLIEKRRHIEVSPCSDSLHPRHDIIEDNWNGRSLECDKNAFGDSLLSKLKIETHGSYTLVKGIGLQFCISIPPQPFGLLHIRRQNPPLMAPYLYFIFLMPKFGTDRGWSVWVNISLIKKKSTCITNYP